MGFDLIRGRGALACAAAALALALSSCSSSSSGDGGSGGSEAAAGVFLDGGLVEGLDYATDTHSGTTDADGTFTYEEGETVTFSIGDFALGEAEGAEVVTAWDLAQNEDAESINAFLNRIVFLQTLDDNDDVSDGIFIAPDVTEFLAGEEFDFAGNTDVSDFFSEFDVSSVEVYLIDGIGNNALENFVNAMDEEFDYPIESLSPNQGESGTCTFAGNGDDAIITFTEAMDEDSVELGDVLMFDLRALSLMQTDQIQFVVNSNTEWTFGHNVAEWDADYLLVLSRNVRTASGTSLPAPFLWYSGSVEGCV